MSKPDILVEVQPARGADQLAHMKTYAKKITKQQITIKLDGEIIEYFKQMAEETGMSYQGLINLYLRDCVKSKRQIEISWK